MIRLEVSLNKDSNSFDKGFACEFDGALTILSGVNGSGKSHLLEIIKGATSLAAVKIDGEPCFPADISFRSFKDNISISEIATANFESMEQSVKQAWNLYVSTLLNENHPNCAAFASSCKRLKEKLHNRFTEERFKTKGISEQEFGKFFNDESIIWKPDDLFSETISMSIIDYLYRVKEAKILGYENGNTFDLNSLGPEPWTEMNKLLKRLNIEYQLKTDFKLLKGNLNQIPVLYPIDQKGRLDVSRVGSFSVLSDGEKAILSLIFASLSGVDRKVKRLLLLDEYDATLNPSLIETFYNILDEYFIQKEIMVVMTTHSPTAISLAPKYATFYEVNKKNSGLPRILKIDRSEYVEIELAYREFYQRQEKQAEIIRELTLVAEKKEQPLIITEGKTDWKHLLKALNYFHSKKEFLSIKEEFFLRYGSEGDLKQGVCGTQEQIDLDGDSGLARLLSQFIETRQKDPHQMCSIRIGVFDSDKKPISIYGDKQHVHTIRLIPEEISIEQMYTDDEIKQEIEGRRLFLGTEFDPKTGRHKSDSNLNIWGRNGVINKAGKNTIIENSVFNDANINVALPKEHFAIAVYNGKAEISTESWEGFRATFTELEKLLPACATILEGTKKQEATTN